LGARTPQTNHQRGTREILARHDVCPNGRLFHRRHRRHPITIAEAAVEKRAGLTEQQSVLPAIFIFQLLGASIVEEMLFRGFVAPGELFGRKLLALMIVGSLVFALIHNFDLSEPEGKVSALFAFITSLWLYVVRFNPLNPDRSLLPCFMAHTVRNLAVFGIKGAQGFISW